jgi:ribosomal protein S27E
VRHPAAELPVMGFNKRRMESERAVVAAKEAEARRALGSQSLEDAERLIAAWNARQEGHMPMLFSLTIGAAITARYWFLWVRCPACRTTQSVDLWVRCPACRTTQSVDLRTLDRHRDAAVTSLIPSLSRRSCRPYAPLAELLCLSQTCIADEICLERSQRTRGDT